MQLQFQEFEKNVIIKQKNLKVLTKQQLTEIFYSTLNEFNDNIDDNNLNILFNNIQTIGFIKVNINDDKFYEINEIDWYEKNLPKELIKKFNNNTNIEIINEFKSDKWI